MIKFTIKDGKLTVDERILMIEAFADIWEYYKKKKDMAVKMLLYVFFMNDITKDNPMLDVPDYDRRKQSMRNAYRKDEYKFNDKEKELYNNAAKVYRELTEDAVVRLGRVVNNKIEEISTFLSSYKGVDKDNAEVQMDYITKIEKLLATKVKIDDQIERHTTKVKAKGDRFRSPLEQGKIGYKPS